MSGADGKAGLTEKTRFQAVIDKLLQSDEPSVRYKVWQAVGQVADSVTLRQLQEEIRTSPRVKKLLSERDDIGQIPVHPYTKWSGAHWVLADLADNGYPAGDGALIPLREQVYDWLFSPPHQKNIRLINGRIRRCASQEGNALYATLKLGLADERADELASRLVQWQWPDGGWNCDRHPHASHSSFMESLIPMRGLALHARLTGNPRSREAVQRTAEIFLKRHLYQRQQDGSVIHQEFIRLHYPCYWHYDILFGLKVLAEAGFIGDSRCQQALELLVSKQLADGGFPAEKCYYRVTDRPIGDRSLVSWGGTSQRNLNEFVTADVLAVLSEVGGGWNVKREA